MIVLQVFNEEIVLNNIHKAGDVFTIFRGPLENIAGVWYDIFTDYPPERAGQVYIRTLDLRDSWQDTETIQTPTMLSVGVESLGVPYNMWVQSLEYQTPPHVDRWPTVENQAQIAEVRVPQVLKEVWLEAIK